MVDMEIGVGSGRDGSHGTVRTDRRQPVSRSVNRNALIPHRSLFSGYHYYCRFQHYCRFQPCGAEQKEG
jgi:hypothetical protein